jgi:hypothetical protein
MVWDRVTIQQRLQATPPRCLHEIYPEAVPGVQPEGGMIIVAWAINLGPTSGGHCSVVGTPTRVEGHPPSILLFGNLAVEANEKLIEIFDPTIHGYQNEVSRLEDGAQDNVTREIFDDRKEYSCPRCASTVFSLTAVFYYQEGAIEVFLREPELPISDMFNSFNLYGVCIACHKASTIAEFDGL